MGKCSDVFGDSSDVFGDSDRVNVHLPVCFILLTKAPN